jgi:hypothetical protein
MLLTPRLTFSLFFSLFLAVGCAIQPSDPQVKSPKTNYIKVFPYNFDSVWRAAQLTLKYPIAVNNIENGVLETEWIRGTEGYTSPASRAEPSAGIRYKIIVNMVKGKLDRNPSVRMTIAKKIERQRDFFSDVENIFSDGLEEKVIFYRIEREIVIEEALKKASSKNQ